MAKTETGVEDQRRMALATERNGARQAPHGSPRAPGRGIPRPVRAGRSKPRIDFAEAVLMIGVALFFDGVQAVLAFFGIGLILNSIVSIVAWLVFFLWLHAKGLSYGAGLKGGLTAAKSPAAINAATLLVGVIPFLNILPERTVGIVAIIVVAYAERTAGGMSAGTLLEKAHTV